MMAWTTGDHFRAVYRAMVATPNGAPLGQFFENVEAEMAKLTTKKRNSLPKSTFGEPGKRKYPMPDKSHAANAKARASQAVNAGRMSRSEESRIDAKANRVLGKKRGK